MYRKLLALMLALLLCCAALAEAPAATPTAEAAGTPATDAPEADADAAEAPSATAQPAKAYVLVTTATKMGFLPLPEEGEYSYHLEQVLPDGTPAENVIHLSSDGVWMEESTCENHDCIDQGHVTLDNIKDRILGNMIICLPNQVSLQLLTPEEILAMMQEDAQ